MKSLASRVCVVLLVSLVWTPGCGDGGERSRLVSVHARFLRGNEAYTQSLVLAKQAAAGDREAAKAAEMRAEDALALWQAAATTRRDWPAARRNVERALLLLARLRGQKKEGTKRRKVPPKKELPPKTEDEEEAAPRRVATKDLPGGRVLGLLEVLARREQEKHAQRRARRRAASRNVERDW